MPKNNKTAVGRTLLFVLLTAAVLTWGGNNPALGAFDEGLLDRAREVIGWVVSAL